MDLNTITLNKHHEKKMNSHLIIWDLDYPPNKKILQNKSTLILWRNYKSKNFPKALSIPTYVEKHSKYLHGIYLSWIHELGEIKINKKKLVEYFEIRPGFSYWWMSLLAEKSNYAKSLNISNVIKLFALDKWSKINKIKKIEIYSSNRLLLIITKEWSNYKKIVFEAKLKPNLDKNKKILRLIYNKLPLTIKALLWLVRFLSNNWNLRGAGIKNWKSSNGEITFVSYLFNTPSEAIKNNKYFSPFWTKLSNELNKSSIKTNWLHIYVKDKILFNSVKAAEYINNLNSKSQNLQIHTTLSSFLSIKVIFKTLRDWLFLRKKNKKINLYIHKKKQIGFLLPFFSTNGKSLYMERFP